MQVLAAKAQRDADPPSRIASGIPPEWDDIASRLLLRDPAARPTGRELLAWLGQASELALRPAPVKVHTCIGRDDTLNRMLATADQMRVGRAAVIHISGPSGFGKSTIVQAFATSFASAAPEAIVIRGCRIRRIRTAPESRQKIAASSHRDARHCCAASGGNTLACGGVRAAQSFRQRKSFLQVAQRCCRTLRGKRTICGLGLALAIDGGIEAACGRAESAHALCGDAERELRRSGIECTPPRPITIMRSLPAIKMQFDKPRRPSENRTYENR